MDEQKLKEILGSKREEDWLEFKSEFKLYQSDNKIREHKRDEFFKDVLGLANGNAQIFRKTKYLFIGVDNKEFNNDGICALHDVCQVPDFTGWLP